MNFQSEFMGKKGNKIYQKTCKKTPQKTKQKKV